MVSVVGSLMAMVLALWGEMRTVASMSVPQGAVFYLLI